MKTKTLFVPEISGLVPHFERTLLLPALLLAAIAGPTTVRADQYRWTMSGNINNMSTGFWDASVSLGTPLTISMVFDTNSTPSRFDDFFNGGGNTFYSVSDFSIAFGDYSLGETPGYWPGPYMSILNDLPVGPSLVDGYVWQYDPLVPKYGLSDLDAQGALWSFANLFNSGKLVPPGFALSTYDLVKAIGVYGNLTPGDYNFPSRQFVSAIVTSNIVEAVPEPAACLGIPLAAAAIFLNTRRKKATA